ncbi:MAG: DUF4350 domain-containing protein [Planctomycetes bacterium]|nr:DUF4350 domain-containing protein [Planctomycetota bacterium]
MKGQTENLRKRLLTPKIGGRETMFRWIMLGVFAAGLGYVLIRGVFEQPKKPDNFSNSYSASPGGHSALAELLSDLGFKVQRRVTPLNRLGPEYYAPGGSCVTVLEPDPEQVASNKREFKDLLGENWRSPRAIIALPKRWYYDTHGGGKGIVEVGEGWYRISDVNIVLAACGLSSELSVFRTTTETFLSTPNPNAWRREHPMFGDDEPVPEWRDPLRTRLHTEPIQAFRFADNGARGKYEVLIQTEQGDPVVIQPRVELGLSRAILVSDADFLSNRFIGQGNAAALAMKVFRAADTRTFDIDESMHGLASQASIEYLAATPPGLWFTLSLFIVLLMFGWREATVLRPAVADTETRRSRGVVIEGLARMMARARDYVTASTALLRRAHNHLGAGPVQVHASGMAGSTSSALAKDQKATLEAIKIIPGEGALNVLRAAQTVSSLKNKEPRRATPQKKT